MALNSIAPSQLLWIAVAVVALINVAVCIAVTRSIYFSRGQATAQAVLVWLVPVLGAVLVGLFLWSQRDTGSRRESSVPMEAAGLGDGSLDGGGHAP